MSSLLAAALAAVGTALLFSWAPHGSSWAPPGSGERPSDAAEGPVLEEHRGPRQHGRRVPTGGLAPAGWTVGLGPAVAAVVLGRWWGAPPVLSVVAGAAAAVAPVAWRRRRARAERRSAARCWPRLLDDLRVRTGALGRPIPQALLEVGGRGPAELRPAFADAAREWTLTTDPARMLGVLKDRLGDPVADAVCETLLVAHEVGGDLDARLAALAEDCRVDLRHRAEAEARQAGARVARWFVLVVPAGMALAGLRMGAGTDAFGSLGAQLAVGGAVAMIAGCWWWAGRIMSLPERPRVFDR